MVAVKEVYDAKASQGICVSPGGSIVPIPTPDACPMLDRWDPYSQEKGT